VIGGIQRFNAILKLKRSKKAVVQTRRCLVYGKGLQRSAALSLARQHNECNQIQRVTTFPEIAASCRRLLLEKFGSGQLDDENSRMPNIPRYNSTPYREFKQECLSFLVSTQMVSVEIFLLSLDRS